MYACTENVEAVCLEVKPSGKVSNSLPPRIDLRDDTFMRVQTQVDSRGLCNAYSINPRLNEYVRHPTPHNVNDFKFELSLNEAFLYGQTTKLHVQGFYRYTGDSRHDLDMVRDRALDACRTGVDPAYDVDDRPTNRDNYALEFNCV
jgi:hypothetical protein